MPDSGRFSLRGSRRCWVPFLKSLCKPGFVSLETCHTYYLYLDSKVSAESSLDEYCSRNLNILNKRDKMLYSSSDDTLNKCQAPLFHRPESWLPPCPVAMDTVAPGPGRSPPPHREGWHRWGLASPPHTCPCGPHILRLCCRHPEPPLLAGPHSCPQHLLVGLTFARGQGGPLPSSGPGISLSAHPFSSCPRALASCPTPALCVQVQCHFCLS